MYFIKIMGRKRSRFINDIAHDGIVKTVTIIDFVVRNQIEKVGFIELDIEGA